MEVIISQNRLSTHVIHFKLHNVACQIYFKKKLKNFSVNKMSLLNIYSMILTYLIALYLEGIFVMDFYTLSVGNFFLYYLEEYLS